MFELSLPWDMDTVSGVKASGVVVEQFEDAGEGRCRRSWSITTRSLDFPGLSNRGSAAELEGELFVKGARVYVFRAAQASFEKLEDHHGAVRVSGEISVEDLERDVKFDCAELTWMPEKRSLSLDRGVTAIVPSKFRVTCPKLIVSAAESSKSLEETVATVSEQRRRGCLSSSSLEGSAVLHGPCHGQIRLPFEGIRPSSLVTLSSMVQAAQRRSPGGVELEFYSDKLVYDMKHQCLLAQGPLSLSCFQNQFKIHAGAGDILLREGFVTLHSDVCGRLHGYELKAPSVTWYYGREEAKRCHTLRDSKGADLGRFACKTMQMTSTASTSGAQQASFSRFTIQGMQVSRQMVPHSSGTRSFWTACRSTSVGHNSLPRCITRSQKPSTFKNVFKTIFSMDSSRLRLDLWQLLLCIPALEGCVRNFGVPLGTYSSIRERSVYPALAAKEEKSSPVWRSVSADVVVNGPSCICRKEDSRSGSQLTC